MTRIVSDFWRFEITKRQCTTTLAILTFCCFQFWLFVGSVAECFGASFLRRPWSQGWWFNSHANFVVAFLYKMLHDNYLCLVDFDKQEIEEVTSKVQAESSETKATPKRVWIRPMHSASVAFSWQEDENEKIKSSFAYRIFKRSVYAIFHATAESCYMLSLNLEYATWIQNI